MDYREIIRIDKAGGRGRGPLSRFARKVTERLTRKGETGGLPRNPESILVIKLWGMGNMLLAGRAIKSLREKFPNASLTLLSTPDCLPIYEKTGIYNGSIRMIPDDDLTPLCAALGERKFDLVVNLEGLSATAERIALGIGASATVGFYDENDQHPPKYTFALPYSESEHIEEQMCRLSLACGGLAQPPGLIPPEIGDQDRMFAREMLYQFGVEEHDLLVGFSMNSSAFRTERGWPPEKFALLAQELEAEEEFRTVFVGGREHMRDSAKALQLMENNGLDLTGKLSFHQLAALMERMHLLVGCDSMPLHLAAAMGVATVGIFGPDSPERVGRLNSEEHATIYKPTECSPCCSIFGMMRDECLLGGKCVADITVEEVRSAITDMLDHLADPDLPPWLEE